MIELKERKKWPVRRDRVKTFAQDATLSKLRQYTSPSFQHVAVLIKEASSRNRKKCILCSKGNEKYRQTSYMCNICEVPLCTRRYGLVSGDSCFSLWHKTGDLIGTHENSNDKVEKAKLPLKRSAEEMDEVEHEDEESLSEFTGDAVFLGDQQGSVEDGRAESDREERQELELPPLPPLTTLTRSQLEGRCEGVNY